MPATTGRGRRRCGARAAAAGTSRRRPSRARRRPRRTPAGRRCRAPAAAEAAKAMAASVVHMKNETRLGRCSPRAVAMTMGMGNRTLHSAPIQMITPPNGTSATTTGLLRSALRSSGHLGLADGVVARRTGCDEPIVSSDEGRLGGLTPARRGAAPRLRAAPVPGSFLPDNRDRVLEIRRLVGQVGWSGRSAHRLCGVALGVVSTSLLTVYKERLTVRKERETRAEQRRLARLDVRESFQRESLLALQQAVTDLVKAVYDEQDRLVIELAETSRWPARQWVTPRRRAGPTPR